MKRVVIVLGIVVAVLLGAFALIWFVPAVQDRIVQSAMTRQIAKNARTPYLGDDALHILLCGTGSPMPDMTRANACAAVIAGGPYTSSGTFRPPSQLCVATWPRSPIWSEWRCVSSTVSILAPGILAPASRAQAPGPASITTTRPFAITAAQAFARVMSGIGEPVPHNRMCKASSLR